MTTIFVNHTPGTYKAYKTIGGWSIMFLDEQNNSRPADGGKIYKHRQNAYRRAKQLNESLPKTLEEILKKADTAWYEWDGYNVYVQESSYPDEPGYTLKVCKEAFPPHYTKTFRSLDQVECDLNGTLSYSIHDRKWQEAID